MKKLTPLSLAVLLMTVSSSSMAEMSVDHSKMTQQDHEMMMKHLGMAEEEAMPVVNDQRELVLFPEAEYHLTLQNMRDHLRGVNLALMNLASGDYVQAAEAIEQHLGFGNSHGANGLHSAREYMPPGMQMLGHGMHTKANALATTLRDAEITEESQEIFLKMADLTSQCVACHDAYRLGAE
ncbi:MULTISPECIES: hypothetical protein [unclassified Marinobacterium]|uniref:hypothetical protein n=1 Tax=unclassified Marinobacterium TaxID=2644139 RepID=UPI001569754A|nr:MULTISPECIES: hypothetical protein [unclassified Marinobacterium]NRP58233.1 hypothetical protein [Marinobacterium sp. xm-d-510]NRP97415.1 hypothetical protein [Marinobacterium sp. xm-a-127]